MSLERVTLGNGKKDNVPFPAIPRNHITIGLSGPSSLLTSLSALISSRALPAKPYTPSQISYILSNLALMDTQNHPSNLGLGEREGRVASTFLQGVYAGCPMSHGIGRSGDLAAPQPKAAGSSVLYALCQMFLRRSLIVLCGFDWMKKNGLGQGHVAYLPSATGVSLMYCLLSLPRKSKVVWLRIDQKSAPKAVALCGMELVVCPTTRSPSGVVKSDLSWLSSYLAANASDVTAVISCTSCFAPREPDDVPAVAKMCTAGFCSSVSVPHIINNAYGLQSRRACSLINKAVAVGRVDLIVSSCDKNFLVPVGSAIVYGPDKDKVKKIQKQYPGRASGAGVRDLVVSFLELGEPGYRRLYEERVRLSPMFRSALEGVAAEFGEEVLTMENDVSFCMTLKTLEAGEVSELGSALFTRATTGARAVPPNQSNAVAGITLEGWGSSTVGLDWGYLTTAIGVGMSEAEVGNVARRVGGAIKEVLKKRARRRYKEEDTPDIAKREGKGED